MKDIDRPERIGPRLCIHAKSFVLDGRISQAWNQIRGGSEEPASSTTETERKNPDE